jgi:hypothetical protein
VVWKKTRQVIHTAEEPPRMGRSCLAAMGSMRKRRRAERKMVTDHGWKVLADGKSRCELMIWACRLFPTGCLLQICFNGHYRQGDADRWRTV